MLYADDLVILSTSEKGLQCSINKLQAYCQRWKLSINPSKSKAMCFTKQSKKQTVKVKLDDDILEQVDTYNYLGFEITCCGSFKNAQAVLCNKGMKAMYKLRKLLCDVNLTPDVCLKLFDQLIKPICLYGAEIWSPESFDTHQSLNESLDENKFEECYSKLLCEKLNLSFLRLPGCT